MHHNSQAIPPDLKALPQWLGYKETKAPRVAFGTHHLASYNNSDAHTDYPTALSAVANGDLDGIGIAVTEYDPYVIIDLDGCRDKTTGELSDFAAGIVTDLGSYTEVSNSGKGLHIVCRSYVDGNYKANEDERAGGRAIEFFGTAGFVILTGHVVKGHEQVSNVPRAKLRSLVEDLRMTRKARKTYERSDAPAHVEIPDDPFEVYSALGPFAQLVLKSTEDPTLSERFPRDRDGQLDRSKALFLAALNLKDAGMTAAEAFTMLDQSPWVTDFMEEKAPGWLWRYVVEPAFKSTDGEVPVDEIPETPEAVFLTQAELVLSLQPVDWLIEGALEANATGILAGKHSTYKSTIAIDWVHSVASGLPWMGRPTRQGAAVVIAGEGSRGLARRAHAWGVEHEVTGDRLAELPVLWSRAAVQIMDAERMGRAVATITESLKTQFQVAHPELVVIDTLNKNFAGGDENSASDISLFLDRLARAFPRSSIVIVHHFGKDKHKGSRGSSAIDASVDFLYHVEAAGGEITLRSQKMKDADRPSPMYLRPEVIPLKLDEQDETTGVTIGTTFRSNKVVEGLGRMKVGLQTVATSALAVLADLEEAAGPPDRKTWVDALLGDEIAAEEWDRQDRNSWRTQLNKLVASMAAVGLVGMVLPEEGEEGGPWFQGAAE